MNANVNQFGIPTNVVSKKGLAVQSLYTHAFTKFVLAVAHQNQHLKFETIGHDAHHVAQVSRLNVMDPLTNTKLGQIWVDHSYRTSKSSIVMSSQETAKENTRRMVKRTADLDKAVKMFGKYFPMLNHAEIMEPQQREISGTLYRISSRIESARHAVIFGNNDEDLIINIVLSNPEMVEYIRSNLKDPTKVAAFDTRMEDVRNRILIEANFSEAVQEGYVLHVYGETKCLVQRRSKCDAHGPVEVVDIDDLPADVSGRLAVLKMRDLKGTQDSIADVAGSEFARDIGIKVGINSYFVPFKHEA